MENKLRELKTKLWKTKKLNNQKLDIVNQNVSHEVGFTLINWLSHQIKF